MNLWKLKVLRRKVLILDTTLFVKRMIAKDLHQLQMIDEN